LADFHQSTSHGPFFRKFREKVLPGDGMYACFLSLILLTLPSSKDARIQIRPQQGLETGGRNYTATKHDASPFAIQLALATKSSR
jgi:hypothetical protein